MIQLLLQSPTQSDAFCALWSDRDLDDVSGPSPRADAPKLRHSGLAAAVTPPRPQLTNVLRGRFGTAAATVGTLKRVLSAWGLAA